MSNVLITQDLIKKWYDGFYKYPKNIMAQNYCVGHDPINACLLSPQCRELKSSTKTTEIDKTEYKVIQKGEPLPNSNKYNWIYTGLNLIRLPFMHHFQIESFEFSAAYLLYWHKIERCNYFLNTAVEMLRNGELPHERRLRYFLKHPVPNGGQWYWLVNLIKKYGLMPKANYLNSASATATRHMNTMLRAKLLEYVSELDAIIKTVEANAAAALLTERIGEMMASLYKVVSICLGIPQETFTWEYYNKAKEAKSLGPLTPLEFYENNVRPQFNVEAYICIGTDPRPDHLYDQVYTCEYNTNMVNGELYRYINQPAEKLVSIVVESLKAHIPVWCACDTQENFSAKNGELCLDLHDFTLVFDIECRTGLTKAQRMLYHASHKNQALMLTSVVISTAGEHPIKLHAIASSPVLGGGSGDTEDDSGDGGMHSVQGKNVPRKKMANKGHELVMSADWFHEYVYEIVVDKRFVPPQMLECLQRDALTLPIWDAMGNVLV